MKTPGSSPRPHDPPRCTEAGPEASLVAVRDLRAAGDTDTCLRPLGLCELGGSCDSCWYRPDHPRFRQSR